jgi:cysteine sulfinate desulfinase/cysteine desulfurase-like protein
MRQAPTRGPAPVLRTVGLTDEQIQGSIRIGLGRATTKAGIEFAIERLLAAIERLSSR